MSSLFAELKRRNVFRVAIAYVAITWLIIQVADIVFENFGTPDWVMKTLMFILAAGFPVAILLAWAFEMTPDGIRREKDVDRATSITRQTGQKLNRMIIGVLIAAVAFLLVDKFALRDSTPAPVASSDKSVAVLPFVAMSRGEDDEYFADGLTEEILNSLTRVPELLVTARTSAFYFKGQDIPVPAIAEKLGVANVVEGSVRRDGNRLRVTAQLIRAADGFHLWSKNYDRETDDTFGVQTNIAEEISAALGVVLDDTQVARMQEAGIRDPDAFIALQKGVEAFSKAHGSASLLADLQAANQWFERALELEPDLADAYLYHADYYTHVLLNSVDDPSISSAQQDAAFRQLVSDHDNGIRAAEDQSRRIAASFDLAVVSGNWRSVPELFSQLVEDGGCIGSSWADAIAAAYGQAESLGVIAKRMVDCDPLGFSGWRWLSLGQLWAGDVEAAIATAQRGLEASNHVRLAQILVSTYVAAGRIDDAEQVIAQYMRDASAVMGAQELIASARGDAELAKEIFDRLIADDISSTIGIIGALAKRGARDEANRRAAEVDAHPFGYLRLMLVPQACLCGAPWDLEYTPNFAKLLEDANLPWPPASPINWPLKDW